MFDFDASACLNHFMVTIKETIDNIVNLALFLGDMDSDLRKKCPNKRVVHLAYHAKKERTRKKNLARMIKIIEKQEKKNK